MPRKRVCVGVSDHSGYAVLMTARADGTLIDRRRVELVDEGLTSMPHHHDAQKLPIAEGVALVERVRRSMQRNAKARLQTLAEEVDAEIAGIALRVCPPMPATVAECIQNYRAMCVADWVMLRQTLAAAALARGWEVHWFEAKTVFADAAKAMKRDSIEPLLEAAKAAFGTPWQKDHRLAMAAAIYAAVVKPPFVNVGSRGT